MSVIRWKSNVKFLWTGTGTGDVVSEGAANASFALPGAALDGLLVDYVITNINSGDAKGLPTEREVGRNLWSDGVGAISPDGTLTRTDGAPADRNSAGVIDGSNGTNRVSFTAGDKLVSITPVGETFGTAADVDVGIGDGQVPQVDATAGAPADDEFARFTASGIEGRTPAEAKSDLGFLTDVVDDTTPQLGGTLECLDNVVNRPELQDYAETSTTPSSAAGTLDLDLETGNVFEITLTEDVTTLNLNNPPATGKAGSILIIIIQDATGGWSITWPASVQWPGGTAPTLTGTASSADVISLVTRDGGTTWYGFEGGLNFS